MSEFDEQFVEDLQQSERIELGPSCSRFDFVFGVSLVSPLFWQLQNCDFRVPLYTEHPRRAYLCTYARLGPFNIDTCTSASSSPPDSWISCNRMFMTPFLSVWRTVSHSRTTLSLRNVKHATGRFAVSCYLFHDHNLTCTRCTKGSSRVARVPALLTKTFEGMLVPHQKAKKNWKLRSLEMNAIKKSKRV